MRKFVALLAMLFLTACGHTIAEMANIPVIDPHNSTAVLEHTEIDYDKHENVTTINGPIIFADQNVFGHMYSLRTWKKGKSVKDFDRIQLYVVASLDDWSFLDSAYSNGKKLDLVKISRDVGACSSYDGCSVRETVGINLTKGKVNELAKGYTNYEVKIIGQKGSIVITVPATYFEGVLQAQNIF